MTLRLCHLLVCLFGLFAACLRLKLGRDRSPQSYARAFRSFFERMGFLWVKVGQMMALRNDTYPRAFCDELEQLRYFALGFPFEIARQTVQAELGRPFGEVFAEFEPLPFRATATCQVHRARLKGKRDWVAVKVQRPGVEAVLLRDLVLIRRLVALITWLGLFREFSWEELLWELHQSLAAEVDYQYEAANLRRVRTSFSKQGIFVPRVCKRLSGRRVLVTEYIPGTLMSEVVELLETEPIRLAGWLQHNNIDLGKVGRRLFLSFLRHLMEDEFLHGNLNPRNIVLLRDNRVAFFDLSALFNVEPEFLRGYVQTVRAVATCRYARAADLILLLSPQLPMVDLPSLKERMIRCFQAWEARSNLDHMPYHEKSLVSGFGDVNKVLFAYRITPSLNYLKLTSTWSTLDASLSVLIPRASYGRLFRRYIRSANRRALRASLRGSSLATGLAALQGTLGEYQQLLLPVLRRDAMVFQGGRSKSAEALASILRFLRLCTLACLVFLTFRMIDVHSTVFDDTLLDEPLERLPFIGYELFLLLFALGVYLAHTLAALERRYWQQDVRLPNTSTLSLSG